MVYKITVLSVLVLCISCSRPNRPAPVASAPSRWVLLTAPSLMSKDEDVDHGPCTGTPYVRAPLVDWDKGGEYDSFEQCAASISDRNPDTDPSHKEGKLTKAELMLGFKCVQVTDARLTAMRPYDWATETLAQ